MQVAKTGWTLLLCMLCSLAQAGNSGLSAERIEAGVQVSGSITIEPDGAVLTHAIDPKYSLSPELAGLIGHEVALWRFEPVLVDGKPARVRVPMHLHLLARQDDKGGLTVHVDGAAFGGNEGTDSLRGRGKLEPPVFPGKAIARGNSGTVYLLLRVDRDGIPRDAAVEQVNLDKLDSEAEMEDMRRLLAKTSIRASKRWRFIPPSTGASADSPYWVVRVPIAYKMSDDPEDAPGMWDTYVPGPRNMDIPWAQRELQMAGAPEALPANGGAFMLEGAPRLLTPPAP